MATLRVVPVKGMGSVTRDRIRVDMDGVAEDRRVFLLDDRGAVVTLRSHPELVQITPDLDLEAAVLQVTLPTGGVARTGLEHAGHELRAHLYGKDRVGRLLPGEVAEALSGLARERIRIVVADHAGVGWDEGPVSILGLSSAAAVGGDRDGARYRMLVEVDGTEPYEEDTWVGREVQLGGARVRVSHQLQRCAVITRSPATGEKDWDGLHALAQVRGRETLCLGVIAGVVQPGEVRIGSEVTPGREVA